MQRRVHRRSWIKGHFVRSAAAKKLDLASVFDVVAVQSIGSDLKCDLIFITIMFVHEGDGNSNM